MHALGLEFGSAAQLSKRPGSVWNCLWGNALKRSPGIIRKSRVSYPGPGFLSSATWPSLPKKHYNGLNQTVITEMIPIIVKMANKQNHVYGFYKNHNNDSLYVRCNHLGELCCINMPSLLKGDSIGRFDLFLFSITPIIA